MKEQGVPRTIDQPAFDQRNERFRNVKTFDALYASLQEAKHVAARSQDISFSAYCRTVAAELPAQMPQEIRDIARTAVVSAPEESEEARRAHEVFTFVHLNDIVSAVSVYTSHVTADPDDAMWTAFNAVYEHQHKALEGSTMTDTNIETIANEGLMRTAGETNKQAVSSKVARISPFPHPSTLDFDQIDTKVDVHNALKEVSTISKRKMSLISLRYGLLGGEHEYPRETAKYLGISAKVIGKSNTNTVDELRISKHLIMQPDPEGLITVDRLSVGVTMWQKVEAFRKDGFTDEQIARQFGMHVHFLQNYMESISNPPQVEDAGKIQQENRKIKRNELYEELAVLTEDHPLPDRTKDHIVDITASASAITHNKDITVYDLINSLTLAYNANVFRKNVEMLDKSESFSVLASLTEKQAAILWYVYHERKREGEIIDLVPNTTVQITKDRVNKQITRATAERIHTETAEQPKKLKREKPHIKQDILTFLDQDLPVDENTLAGKYDVPLRVVQKNVQAALDDRAITLARSLQGTNPDTLRLVNTEQAIAHIISEMDKESVSSEYERLLGLWQANVDEQKVHFNTVQELQKQKNAALARLDSANAESIMAQIDAEHQQIHQLRRKPSQRILSVVLEQLAERDAQLVSVNKQTKGVHLGGEEEVANAEPTKSVDKQGYDGLAGPGQGQMNFKAPDHAEYSRDIFDGR